MSTVEECVRQLLFLFLLLIYTIIAIAIIAEQFG